MHTVISRAALAPRALVLVAFAALGACTDDSVAPNTAPGAKAGVQTVAPVIGYVTNTSGGTETGSLRWAAKQLEWGAGSIMFDESLGGKTTTLDAGLELRGS